MFDPTIYKLIHIVGIILVFFSFGMGATQAMAKDTKNPYRAQLSACHGIGLLLILISGFGMLARLGYMKDIPSWAIFKLIIWVALGGLLPVVLRRPKMMKVTFALAIALGTLSAYFGLFKP